MKVEVQITLNTGFYDVERRRLRESTTKLMKWLESWLLVEKVG